MPKNSSWREDDSYEEDDEGTLFEKYVAHAEENFENPKLTVIEAILKKRGFHIKAEHLHREVLANKLTGAKTVKVVANFALVDEHSEEVVITMRQRTLLAPTFNEEITRRDHEFLKTARIR